MRVLLDECLPRRLKTHLVGHEVTTVPEVGWAGRKNGSLLSLLAGRFDAFVTVDRGIALQQNLVDRPFTVILLRARSNRSGDLVPLVPATLRTLDSAQPGEVVQVSG